MFKSVTIQGFKSIKSQRVDLGRVNILIGGNGVGKSNFLSAFRLAKVVSEGELDKWVDDNRGANQVLYLGRKNTSEIRLIFEIERKYGLALKGIGLGLTEGADYLSLAYVDSYLRQSRKSFVESSRVVNDQIADLFHPLRVYHFVDTGRTSPIKQKCYVDDNRFLREDGSNLAAVLYFIARMYPNRFRQIEQSIHEIAPFFAGFDLLPSRFNNSIIQLSWRQKGASDTYFDAEQLSDGTLRMMCLVTLLMQPELPSIILIDEPELGLHPAALALFGALVKKASRESQIIISTQSIDIVNMFSADDIIVSDNAGKETVFTRLSVKDLSKWQNDYTLGELWEKNVFGGNP